MTRGKWGRNAHEDLGARRASAHAEAERRESGRAPPCRTAQIPPGSDDRAILRVSAVPASTRTRPPQRLEDLLWMDHAMHQGAVCHGTGRACCEE